MRGKSCGQAGRSRVQNLDLCNSGLSLKEMGSHQKVLSKSNWAHGLL